MKSLILVVIFLAMSATPASAITSSGLPFDLTVVYADQWFVDSAAARHQDRYGNGVTETTYNGIDGHGWYLWENPVSLVVFVPAGRDENGKAHPVYGQLGAALHAAMVQSGQMEEYSVIDRFLSAVPGQILAASPFGMIARGGGKLNGYDYSRPVGGVEVSVIKNAKFIYDGSSPARFVANGNYIYLYDAMASIEELEHEAEHAAAWNQARNKSMAKVGIAGMYESELRHCGVPDTPKCVLPPQRHGFGYRAMIQGDDGRPTPFSGLR